MSTITGTHTNGVTLTNIGLNPVTVASTALIESTASLVGALDTTSSTFSWSIENHGTIKGKGGSTFGVELYGGGTVNNVAGGYIGAILEGVVIGNKPGTVLNAGVISTTGTSSVGVNLDDGGYIFNIGRIVGMGADPSNPFGGVIDVGGPTDTIVNYGTIQNRVTTGAVIGLYGFSNNYLYNAGYIKGHIYAAGDTPRIASTGSIKGDVTLSSAGSVFNSGNISTSFNGIQLNSGGTVTNAAGGMITSTSNSGVFARNTFAANRVTNLGTIQTTGSAVFAAVAFGNGTIVNGSASNTQALIACNLAGLPGNSMLNGLDIGVDLEGSTTSHDTLVNYGTIAGAWAGVVNNGVVVNGASNSTAALIEGRYDGISHSPDEYPNTTVTNFGTIVGLGTDGDGIHMFNSETRNTIVNWGTIRGAGGTAVATGVGDDRVVVNPGAVFIGIVDTGTGLNEIDFNRTGTIKLGAEYVGFSTVRLGNGGTNTVTLGQADVAALPSGGTVTVYGGDGSNSVDASGLLAGHALYFLGNSGKNHITGGADADTFAFAASELTATDTVAGGGGVDTIIITSGGGGVSVTHVTQVEAFVLASSGADTLTLTNANFTGVSGSIEVTGGNHGNTVNAAALSATHAVVLKGGKGTDAFTGGTGDDEFDFAASTLSAADTVTGGGGTDKLVMSSSGTIHVDGVSGVETYSLSSTAANTVTLADANFVGVTGNTITFAHGSAGNTINAHNVSAGNSINVTGTAAIDRLTGGAGDDTFKFSPANLTASDMVHGGFGADTLQMTAAGNLDVSMVSGIETYKLASTGANTLTLTTANFGSVSGNQIAVFGGNAGNTISGSALSASQSLVVHAGSGVDKLTGGSGDDIFDAGGNTTMTGHGGSNEFVFAAPGANTIADFAASTTNEIVFSNSGFNLGDSGASATPKALPSAQFTSNSNGTFTGSAQRFAYATANGQLFYSANGTTAAEQLVVTLTSHPALTAAHLFYIT